MSVTTTAARQGHFEVRFWHRVFEEEVARVKGGFGPCNTCVRSCSACYIPADSAIAAVNRIACDPRGIGYAIGGEDGYVRLHAYVLLLSLSLLPARLAGEESSLERHTALTTTFWRPSLMAPTWSPRTSALPSFHPLPCLSLVCTKIPPCSRGKPLHPTTTGDGDSLDIITHSSSSSGSTARERAFALRASRSSASGLCACPSRARRSDAGRCCRRC